MVTPALSVAVAPQTAGARRVRVTIVARYEMQCGWPGPGTLIVRFPAGMRLPVTVAAGSVLVDGRPATTVSASAATRSITVALPKRPQIMCDAIGPGTLTVSFARSAKLGSPSRAGSYVVGVRHGADSFAGKFTITR